MATDDIRLSIMESDNSKMCTRSSNKVGLQISPPSNLNPHIKIEVIEGELVNSIRKPRTKCLEEDPNQLCEMSLDSNDWSFYKVPYPLRQVNEKAYEPNVISIGPYHHGKKHLETMEVIKRNCFSNMIKENNVEPEKFVTVMKKLEEEKQFRKCYPLDGFDSDTFVEMMVLDGCFIVLLFQGNDYLLNSLGKLNTGILANIYCDLLLLENQLPLIVLSKLYDVINMSNVEIDKLPSLDLSVLSSVIPGPHICLPKKFPQSEEIKHLLGLVHHRWLLSARKDNDAQAKETKAQRLRKFICCVTEPGGKGIERKGDCSREFIRCATELEGAGINFVNKGKEEQDKDRKDEIGEEEQDKDRKDEIGEEEQDKKGKSSLFDIDFTDYGKLKIPTLRVDDNTERILRNFMAYEQFPEISKLTYVCDYVTLMNNLINSGKDVQLLCNCGIIVNWLGNDEVVAQMFSKLRDFICLTDDSDKFYYAKIFEKVKDHCNRRRNRWRANLNKDYFNSPWSIISVLAAFVLLLLTGVQTIFSVLSYVHPK